MGCPLLTSRDGAATAITGSGFPVQRDKVTGFPGIILLQ